MVYLLNTVAVDLLHVMADQRLQRIDYGGGDSTREQDGPVY
jgi:hypothetical protein